MDHEPTRRPDPRDTPPNHPHDDPLTIFGLPRPTPPPAAIVIPAGFEATVSYGAGTERGPRAILHASAQLDLLDRRFGPVADRGIDMLDEDPELARLGALARPLVRPLHDAGDRASPKPDEAARIDAISRLALDRIAARIRDVLDAGALPALLGGEHAITLAAVEALAPRAAPFGLLQVDAHMDLRHAYQGLRHSHASVMRRALEVDGAVSRLVQVGIRDVAAEEVDHAAAMGDRVHTRYADDLWDALADGRTWNELCREIIEPLPERVYVSFDIDGLEPSLCPGTGTPVPGGLSFAQASILLDRLARSGRRIIGVDLVEVAPQDGDGEWNANVGARVLYRLLGAALA